MKPRQARFPGGNWTDFGHVTHVEAARRFAAFFDNICTRIVETRDRPGEGETSVIFSHRVTRKVVFDVTPLRGDE